MPLPLDPIGIQLLKRIEAAYAQAGGADQFSHFIEPGAGHVLSEEMWERARTFFNRPLRGAQ